MAERVYYCVGCGAPHPAPLWFVHQLNDISGPIKADYLCGTAHSQLPTKERIVWGLLV